MSADEIRLARARFVADYWRRHMLAAGPSWAAHPLCMVLAVLDGEADPIECGIGDDEAEDFLAIGMTTPAVPNPGSPEAVAAGCSCAVLDNCHGRFPPHPDGHWWITEGCPLHDHGASA